MSSPAPLQPPSGLQPPDPHPNAPAVGQRLGPHYSGCYGCGEEVEQGLHLVARRDEGVAVRAQLTVGYHHQGAPGLAHGGLLAAALDDTLGYVLYVLQRLAVTGSLQVDYRRPVPLGTELHLAARCTGVEGRKIWAEGEGRLDAVDGPVAVTARALFVAVEREHFERHGRGLRTEGLPGEELYNP